MIREEYWYKSKKGKRKKIAIGEAIKYRKKLVGINHEKILDLFISKIMS